MVRAPFAKHPFNIKHDLNEPQKEQTETKSCHKTMKASRSHKTE